MTLALWPITLKSYTHIMCPRTVRCRYNAINFLTKIHKRQPRARPLGRGMGCLLCIQLLNDILPRFQQLFMQYLIILDLVIAALDCILYALQSSRNHISTSALSDVEFKSLGWRALKTPTAETPGFYGHVTTLTLQYLWPRPPGVWRGGPGCKPGHSVWSWWSPTIKIASGLIPVMVGSRICQNY